MKKIIFIIILAMICNVSLHSNPTESYVDYSEGGAFSWGLFEGIWAYSDTSKIGIDTVPFWKAYIKNGHIDSLYAIEYIDSVYKIHKIEEIDTLFKVHIDSVNGRLYQIGLGKSTYLGLNAGKNDDTTDNCNVGIGFEALYTSPDGYANSAIGYKAMYSTTDGNGNSAMGSHALYANTTGFDNMGIGYFALYSNTTGNGNAGIGYEALKENTVGHWNTGIGSYAGKLVTGGGANQVAFKSVYIGAYTEAGAIGDTNEIVIGANAIGAGDNTVTIGDTTIIKTILRGEVEADSIKSDSIETEELVVNNIARIMYLKWVDDRDLSIHCQSLFELATGRLSAGADSTIIAKDTLTDWNKGATFYDTLRNEVVVYDGNEWEAFAEVYVNGLDTVSIGSAAWHTAKIWTAGLNEGAIVVGDSVIVVKSKGIYNIDVNLGCKSKTTNHGHQYGISINSAIPAIKTRTIEKSSDVDFHSISLGCKLDLSRNDTIRLQVMDTLSIGVCDVYVLYGNIDIEKR